MDAAIRAEFALSADDYACLLHALRARFGVEKLHRAAPGHLSPDARPLVDKARSPDLASTVDHLLCQYLPGAPSARL